jgi:hypothetical protein
VHYRHEEFPDVVELDTLVRQFVELITESVQEHLVIIGFGTGDLHFLLEFGEWSSVSGFVLLEELKNLLDALTGQLLADVVQVV